MKYRPCENCCGTGRVWTTTPASPWREVELECAVCEGRGEIEEDEDESVD